MSRLFTDNFLSTRSYWLFILLGALFGANKTNAQNCNSRGIEISPPPLLNANNSADDIRLAGVAMSCVSHTLQEYFPGSTTYFHPKVHNVSYKLITTESSCRIKEQSGVALDGTVALCACANSALTLTPTKDVNHINGVSTFDLVLISKHILGIEPLTNPYKLIAADANNSKSVTTFDIVELRKLVLGVYTELPNNKSFRFVLRDYTFPNAENPWQATFPESKSFLVGTSDADFFAIKIGDLNNNAVLDDLLQTEDRQQNTLPLGYAHVGGKRGQVLEIPVFIKQSADLTAWQMALQYIPSALKIKGIRWTTGAQPDRYQNHDWNIPTPGELRLLWMDGTGATTHLEANAPLCYIEVELLHDQSDIALHILPEAERIASESYTSDGTPATFSLLPVRDYQAPVIVIPSVIDTKPIWTATVYPNPVQGQFRIEVALPEGGAGTVTFFDALGRSCATQPCIFVPGLNVVSSAQLPALHAGQYMVRIDTPLGRQTIRVVLLK